jgi:hypothetical protein
MLFMVVERFRERNAKAVYRRFREILVRNAAA